MSYCHEELLKNVTERRTEMEEIAAFVVTYAGRILTALLIWVIGSKLIKMLLKFIDTRMDKRHVDESLHSFVLSLLKMTLQVLIALSMASTLGVEITSFVAIVGAASFAVGLAFQGSLANFAGGLNSSPQALSGGRFY